MEIIEAAFEAVKKGKTKYVSACWRSEVEGRGS
jgi:hypothetical protein